MRWRALAQPVFALTGQEGKLFHPLAFTKTFAMAASSLLSVTLVPVAMGLFVRGRIFRESANPVNRVLIRLYRPMITFVLRHRWPVIAASVVVVILTWVPWSRIGSEFMPPLDEGDLLYMPTTLPGLSVTKAKEILQQTDRIILGVFYKDPSKPRYEEMRRVAPRTPAERRALLEKEFARYAV